MLFRLDFQSAVPIYRQIRDQVVLAGLTLEDFLAACKAAFAQALQSTVHP